MSPRPPDYGRESEYASAQYWEARYLSDSSRFEWFLSYDNLRPLLGRWRKSWSVLDVGCGTSTLLSEMRSDGFHGRLVGLDISARAIEAARKQAKDIEFVLSDGSSSPFPDTAFDAIIDKGTIDALLCDENDASKLLASDAARLLKPGGRYLVCSHHRPDTENLDHDPWLSIVLEAILSPRPDDFSAWHLDIHCLAQSEVEETQKEAPTVYLFTKKRRRRKRQTQDDEDSSPALTIELHEYEDEDASDA